MTKEELRRYVAEGLSVGQIARLVGRNSSTVSYHLKKHGLKAPNREKHASRGELDAATLQLLADNGLSIREMAQQLDRSPTAVRYWLDKHEIARKPRSAGRKRLHGASSRGQKVIESICPRHGRTRFALRSDGYYRCRKCGVEAVSNWRRRAKLCLIEECGGACAVCGFDDAPAALEFHHLDPSTKSFGLAARGLTRSYARLREEASKCVLLCANCHAAVESGALVLPGDLTAANLRSKAA
jgi:DNA-binding transcriptional ArsR family regulator